MESFKQKRANLLNDNPIASHGSWISKHSIAAGSPLHQGGSYKQSPLDQIQGNNSTTRRGTFSGDGGDLLDADGDGDTMFNDSNNDGTMASRALNSFNDFNRVAANAATDTIKKQLKGVANVAKSLAPSPLYQDKRSGKYISDGSGVKIEADTGKVQVGGGYIGGTYVPKTDAQKTSDWDQDPRNKKGSEAKRRLKARQEKEFNKPENVAKREANKARLAAAAAARDKKRG